MPGTKATKARVPKKSPRNPIIPQATGTAATRSDGTEEVFDPVVNTDFSNDEVAALIQAVRDDPILWQRDHDSYKIHNKLRNWNAVAEVVNICGGKTLTAAECQKKWDTLLQSYHRVLREYKPSGDAGDGNRQPKWAWYKRFSFMEKVVGPRTSKGNIIKVAQSGGKDSTNDSGNKRDDAADINEILDREQFESSQIHQDAMPVLDSLSKPETAKPIRTCPKSKEKPSKRRKVTDLIAETCMLIQGYLKGATRDEPDAQTSNTMTNHPDKLFGNSISCRVSELPHCIHDIVRNEIRDTLMRYENMYLRNKPTLPQSLEPAPTSAEYTAPTNSHCASM